MTKTAYAQYLQSPEWKETRTQAIADAGNQCERCDLPRWLAEIAYDQDLHVHHKTYKNKGHESPEDLEVLCRRCHEMETFGRSELRAPKEAECDVCHDKHWDYRSPICKICEDVMSLGMGAFSQRLGLSDPSNQYDPFWISVIRDCVFAAWEPWASIDENIQKVTDEVRRHAERLGVHFADGSTNG
jgi:hypothetical protein